MSIPKDLAEKLKQIGDELSSRSINSVVEQCCAEMVEMCETPKTKRSVPNLVKQLDSVRRVQKFAEAEIRTARSKVLKARKKRRS